jgi:plasmid stability protein
MLTFTIRGMPPELHEKLKKRAERHRRSMNNEAITILERALKPSCMSAEEANARAEELNDRIGKTFPDIVNVAKRKGGA